MNTKTLDVCTLAKMLGSHESRLLDAVKDGRLTTVEDPHRILIERDAGSGWSNYYLEREDRGELHVSPASLEAFLEREGTDADRASPAAAWARPTA